MTRPISPYLAPDFYETALAKGRHRDIVGGRWEETGRIQLKLLQDHGLDPQSHLLDIGCGSLRLGCKAVPFLEPGHYWGTDQSAALMQAGRLRELPDPARLPPDHLVEEAAFAFPGIPDTITHALAFAVFTHLPLSHLQTALANLRRFPRLRTFLFTAFLAPDPARSHRQNDGVVTHPDRPPYHFAEAEVLALARAAGYAAALSDIRLPRGQVLCAARPL